MDYGNETQEDGAAPRGQTRRYGTIVGRYLEALEANKPKRGRKRTPESVSKRLTSIGVEMGEATALVRLNLVQERRDLEAELAKLSETVDISALENEFARVAKAYSDSKGLSLGAWKELGVPPELLKRAGISR